MENERFTELDKRLADKLGNGREYRRTEEITVRAAQEGEKEMIVEGYATTFNEPYLLFEDDGYKVYEQVDARAFDECDMSDVIMQYDHVGRVFARLSNGTLQLQPDEHGLKITADLGGTEIGRQLYEEIKGGYTNKMSFGFTVCSDEKKYTEDKENHTVTVIRTINGLRKLYDVSAVSLPANDATEISSRSFSEGIVEELRKELAERERKKKTSNLNGGIQMTEKTTEELIERRNAIGEEIEAEGADIDALDEEFRSIKAELAKREAIEAKKAEIRNIVANGGGETIKEFKQEEHKTMEERRYTSASPEYRKGFMKLMLGQELTKEERSAVDFVATTTDQTYGSGYVCPATLVQEIWDLVKEQHSLLADITTYRTGTILEVAARTAISQGDAKNVDEAAANDDEINTMAKFTLTGKDFSKHVNISYAMAKMSIPAFEDFLRSELADRIGCAIAADAVAQILSDYDDTNNAITSANEGKIVFTDVAAAFAALKNVKGNVVVYANNATIYKYLVGMVDSTGRPIFQLNANEGARGSLIGALVKVEDAVEDDVILIGAPKQVVGNFVQDIMVESDRDIKKHVITYAGYARFECKLLAEGAFATLTVDSGE